MSNISQLKTARLPKGSRDNLGIFRVSELAAENEEEVLNYLSRTPSKTFGMIGFIRSNGLVSEHNRGTFYACRNLAEELQGVALIGHATLFEAESEQAIASFAKIAQDRSDLFMLLGEQSEVQSFWNYYSDRGKPVRRSCREVLFEQLEPFARSDSDLKLRPASLEDLDMVALMHAQTVIEESGINPLETDAEGFRKRCARRIEKGKTWVLSENGKLIFKAEIVTDSPEVIYLEGVYVDPQEQGKGYGREGMCQLTQMLLKRTKAIVILVNDNKKGSQAFYQKIGFSIAGYYDSIFLQDKLSN